LEGNVVDTSFNEIISLQEVKNAICKSKMGKAYGVDGILSEVLHNETAIYFLHVLFNLCFDKGSIPLVWGKCIIKPIPKSSSLDPRDPLSYRGIPLASVVYKMYCRIINSRLSDWVEKTYVLVDEQNGFKRRRVTIDHISSLVDIIKTRLRFEQSTFAAFTDFSMAYDLINRVKLWERLKTYGVSGN